MTFSEIQGPSPVSPLHSVYATSSVSDVPHLAKLLPILMTNKPCGDNGSLVLGQGC
jgi:hypothetical protein